MKDNASKTFSTSGWTNYNRMVGISTIVTLNVVFAFVLGFARLYAGSMLRNPKYT